MIARRIWTVVAAGLCAAACATSALAWGNTGHRMIGALAVQALPGEVPAFLRTPAAAADIGELAREPDRSRGAGKAHDSDRDPGHFLDLDDQGRVLGGPALDALPVTRAEYEAALQAAGANSWKAGYLPYSIIEGWQQLVKDFALWRADLLGEQRDKVAAHHAWLKQDRLRRERQIIQDLGVWAHYVGDASQPLHVSIHYNGWGEGPNPDGFTTQKIHVPLEGPYVLHHLTDKGVRAAMAPYQDCGCPIEVRVARYLALTGQQVRPLYALEKAGGLAEGDPRGPAFMTQRVAAAAAELRDLITDAWTASAYAQVGYPNVTLRDLETGRADPYAVLFSTGD